MNLSSKKLGELGEKIATDYLKKKGYRILTKNYVPKWASFDRKEIDIVVERDGVISFLEVKALSLTGNFSPEQKVNFLKQQKLIKTAESYLLEKKIPFDRKWQIDVIAIKIDLNTRKAKLRHFKNVVGN